MVDNLQIENVQTESFEKKSFGFWLIISLLLVGLAQLLRIVVLNSNTNTFLNDKFAFSLNIPNYISYTLYVAVFFFISRYLYTTWGEISTRLKVGLIFILSGGISNLVERLSNGYVVDYIFISNGVLNVADFYIIAGMFLVLSSQFHTRKL